MAIHVLDEVTINKIAAGEVIDRPASAVKELLENAADSGATHIEVDFESGGKKSIRVTDNGIGIHSDDLPLALQRHATSKLKSIDDLDHLETLGFRGEALASLSSVSELTLQSTFQGASLGAKIISKGGRIQTPGPAAPSVGTQVVVDNLFFNVPARQKFLKSDAGETAALKKVVKAFALGHGSIALTLKQNNRMISHWPGRDFYQRTCQVLEVSPDNAIHMVAEEEGLRCEAVLIDPKLNISTQQGIWIFVQNRPVTDRLIQQAVLEGYRNLVMDHQFPQAVVSLRIDPGQVDVNVHPSKGQVKFASSSRVFKFVSQGIRNALISKMGSEKTEAAADFSYEPSLPTREFQGNLVMEAVTQYNRRALPHVDPPLTPERTKNGGVWSSLQVIGQFANTYIAAQSAQSFVMVDQHAAHERVLFERLKAKRSVEKQMSLVEEVVEIPADRLEALMDRKNLEIMEQLGFEWHQRGPTAVAITVRPAFLADIGLGPLIERLAEQMTEIGSGGVIDDLMGEIWASMSCHGAIRAGRVLSISEMTALLAQMDEFPFSSFCPHGRPVSVRFSIHDIEKMFKRIL